MHFAESPLGASGEKSSIMRVGLLGGVAGQGYPGDSGSKDVDPCGHWNQVKLDFSRPNRPTGSAFIESLIIESEI